MNHSRVVFVGGYFYDPFFGPYPWWPRYAYPYPYYPVFDNRAQVRIQVTPSNAAVYVDGFYAGVVNDFDGFWQRLPLPPGGHTITLYLEGYLSNTQRIYLRPGGSFNLKFAMERLPDGQSSGPPPTAAPVPPPPEGTTMPPHTAPAVTNPPAPAPPSAHGYGLLAMRVQPAHADIQIDGEHWMSSDGEHFEIQLPVGAHRVVIARSGYEPYDGMVDVADARPTTLNVSLKKQ